MVQISEKHTELVFPQRIRSIVLDRDGNSCRICGSFQNIQIHHIIPRSMGRLHDFCNLITVCEKDHRLIENGRLPHWHNHSDKNLYHISPVKGFIHNLDFSKIKCQTHHFRLSTEICQPPIRAYEYKGQEAVF